MAIFATTAATGDTTAGTMVTWCTAAATRDIPTGIAAATAATVGGTSVGRAAQLRTSIALAQLWQTQGKRQDAHDLLAPVYDWFTEGFDTADLKAAKEFLDDLK